MAKKLRHEDSRAVDLLLDRSLTATGHATAAGSLSVKNGKNNFRNRLNAADRMLRVLNLMPASDPSPDLVQRTLQRIEQSPLVPSGAIRTSSSYANDARPQA